MFVIAGATGRTGRVVAETLLAQGKQVRVIVRDAARAAGWRERGAEVAVASLDDAAALGRALAGASGFYALLPEDPGAPDFHGHRRRMAEVMAGAVRAAGVPHVVFLSSLAATLAEGNGPASDLHHAENVLRASGAIVTAIRASYFQDNVLGMVWPARQDGVYPSFLPADLAFPTAATRDIGRLAARCLVEPPARSEIVDLVGPVYSARDMASRLGQALGQPVRVVVVPPEAQVGALVQQGLPGPFAAALVDMFACLAAGRISPQGDRSARATTELDDVLREGLLESPSR